MTFIYQFVPVVLFYFLDFQKIRYKNKWLKTNILADICHLFIVKYYFMEKDVLNLHSAILRRKYGTYYNYYIDFLIENNIIFKASKYWVGMKSNSYKMYDVYLKGEIRRFKNYDKTLLKKWKEDYLYFNFPQTHQRISLGIREKIIHDLNYVNIDFEKAKNQLDKEYNIGIIDDNSYFRNLLCIEAIANKSIFSIWDDFGRLHTNFTTLKKSIRDNFLFINEDNIEEIDIKNSQPYFLTLIIENNKKDFVKEDEFLHWKRLVFDGNLYNYFSHYGCMTRSEVKKMIYRIFFGKNYNNKENRLFKKHWPTIYKWIVDFKLNKGNYNTLAHKLQQKESDVVFEKICKSIKENYDYIKVFTVHDSIYYPKKYRDIVYEVFFSYIQINYY